MTGRTAQEVLQLIGQVLEGSGDVLSAGVGDELRTAVEEGLTDLDERPQPEPVGTAREAFGYILDVATRLIPGKVTVEQLDAARDRIVELVKIGIADLHARPQQIPTERPRVLEQWEQKEAIELALRWYETEAGPNVLAKVAQVQQIMRGETPTALVPSVPTGQVTELVESWEEVAAELRSTGGVNAALIWDSAVRQLRRVITGG